MHSAVGIQHVDLKYPLLPNCFALKTSLLSLPMLYLGTPIQILLSSMDLMLSTHLLFCFNLIFIPYSLSKLTYLITLFFGSTEYHSLVSVNVKTYCRFFLFFWHVLCTYKAK